METLRIVGGSPLTGSMHIQGSKNAALPILAATLLVPGCHEIRNVPQLQDISVMLQVLLALGCQVKREASTVTIDTTTIKTTQIPETLMHQMRSSIFLLGPLLARCGEVETFQPGGCAIGERKVDLHFSSLAKLGAVVTETGSSVRCTAKQLIGTTISLYFPSVGATENSMMAAVTATGTTIIQNAAKEPEIVDLQNFLNAMGAHVCGAGTSTIVIRGVKQLQPTTYTIHFDRIVAGTMLCATVATKGDLVLLDVQPKQLTAVTNLLSRMGARFDYSSSMIRISMNDRPRPVERITTGPYPAFPTDLQAQIMVLLALSEGFSVLQETVFEKRFQHVEQLQRLGATIRTEQSHAYIHGVRKLKGAQVSATDLRAGAALVIAGLVAEGTTIIEQIKHIDRGYEAIEKMFAACGATIYREQEPRREQHII